MRKYHDGVKGLDPFGVNIAVQHNPLALLSGRIACGDVDSYDEYKDYGDGDDDKMMRWMMTTNMK